MKKKFRMIDLTQPLSIHTPPWPSYVPLQLQYFKRIAGAHMGQGANGQILTTSNHVGTHIDGEIHFFAAGRTIGQMNLEEFCGQGVIVDISDVMTDYDLYSSKLLEERADIRNGDILLIKTGYQRYCWNQPESDEIRYFVKHPGPDPDFPQWCIDMKFKWIGVDCGSADHPMNTIIRDWHPKRFKEAEEKLTKKYNVNSWDEMFPPQKFYQIMHIDLFPKGVIHAENLWIPDDPLLKNKRTWIGCFPLKGIELESSMCRIVAFPDVIID